MASTSTELHSGIGAKNSSKVLAPPGGKSSIGFGGEAASAPSVPKNAASAAKNRDLSSNPLDGGTGPPMPPPGSHAVAEQPQVDAPRPLGAPAGRAKVPPGGHSSAFW
jgi:hypothetical protein